MSLQIFSWFFFRCTVLQPVLHFFCYFQFFALFRCSSFILLVFFSYSSGVRHLFFWYLLGVHQLFFSCSSVFVQVLFRFPSFKFQVFLSLPFRRPSVVLLLFFCSYSSDSSGFFVVLYGKVLKETPPILDDEKNPPCSCAIGTQQCPANAVGPVPPSIMVRTHLAHAQ